MTLWYMQAFVSEHQRGSNDIYVPQHIVNIYTINLHLMKFYGKLRQFQKPPLIGHCDISSILLIIRGVTLFCLQLHYFSCYVECTVLYVMVLHQRCNLTIEQNSQCLRFLSNHSYWGDLLLYLLYL